MGIFLTICGAVSLAFAGYAWLALVSDIQLGIVATAAIGGLLLIGLGQLFERIDRMDR